MAIDYLLKIKQNQFQSDCYLEKEIITVLMLNKVLKLF